MRINGVEIEDTFAEAFEMWGARLIITAHNQRWAATAAETATGFATSIIGCGCEAGTNDLRPDEDTPDGRPGVAALFFTTSRQSMEAQLLLRVGQGVMTSPTSACYNGLSVDDRVKVGGKLRYFGDGFQSSKLVDGRRLWRVPVMDGEFTVEESFGVSKAVGGGNFFIMAESLEAALSAAEAAAAAMRAVSGAVMPFPGGIVRSGSKVSSRYKGQHVSSNTPYCPTIRPLVATELPDGVEAVLEIVIDGLEEEAVREATRVGVREACLPGVVRISAGNYGGTLGRYQFHLHELLAPEAD
jgi:formylmethanofuran--tetrahydromethanopterin N-formyltransferase